MSSELDKLVETITEQVLQELLQVSVGPSSANSSPKKRAAGPPVLVVLGPDANQSTAWAPLLESSTVVPALLVGSGDKGSQLPAQCLGWKHETRSSDWSAIVSAYQAVVLLGGDLGLLGGLAVFAGDGSPAAAVAVAALSTGKPVFLDDHCYEQFRRHSSRLPAGLVRRFEELFRLVSSFGVEIGGSPQLSFFLDSLGTSAGSTSSLSKSHGRDVVTVEDVEAVRRSGESKLQVALGTIVTPLAAQRAAEWGIEVNFQ